MYKLKKGLQVRLSFEDLLANQKFLQYRCCLGDRLTSKPVFFCYWTFTSEILHMYVRCETQRRFASEKVLFCGYKT